MALIANHEPEFLARQQVGIVAGGFLLLGQHGRVWLSTLRGERIHTLKCLPPAQAARLFPQRLEPRPWTSISPHLPAEIAHKLRPQAVDYWPLVQSGEAVICGGATTEMQFVLAVAGVADTAVLAHLQRITETGETAGYLRFA
jgi:hypothetical protein